MEQRTLSREELYKLVWSTPLYTLSKQFEVSGIVLRTLCKRLKIPLPKNGHWQQVKFGKAAAQPPLPHPYKGETETTLTLRVPGKTNKHVLGKVSVKSERLINRHPLVIRSKAELENSEPDLYRFLHMLSCGSNAPDIKVTKPNIKRAIYFMDSLIKALEKEGHFLEIRNGKTFVKLGTDTFQIFLRERTTRVKDEIERIGFTRFHSTGKLAFSIGIGHFREFHDGRLKLEEQLPAIMDHIEAVNQEWLDLRRRQRLEEQKERIEQQLLQDAEDRRNKEITDFNALLEKAERWHKSDNLRRYIDEVERRARLSGSIPETIQSWLEWARHKADWYDPFVEKDDTLLSEKDRYS